MSIDRQVERLKEIEKLYDVSEAERILLIQFVSHITTLGFSPKLLFKILQASAALIESLSEET